MKKSCILTVTALLALACAQPAREYSNTIAVDPGDSPAEIISKAAHVVPTANQMRALEREFIAFAHFGPNTFTAKEWGSGMEDPGVFDLETLDTDQWCRAMKAAGMKMIILTVKHHDGFVLWQSRYTTHGVMSSPFQDGKGDVFKSLSQSCAKYGLDLGFYLSPADLYQIESPDGLYGNLSKPTWRTIPRAVEGRPFADTTTFRFCVDDYNEYYLNQLFELLTEYGPIKEVWLDGAHPKRKGGQTYDYHAWKEVIHTLAPEAVVFGREDVRWCGNEAGETRETEWNVIPYQEDPDTLGTFHDMTDIDLGSDSRLLEAKFLHYQQAETDVSIRNGWFYRNDDEQEVRSADNVFDIYERSVGGNSTLILNIPPNREGRFPDRDVAVLEEVGRRIRSTYGKDLLDVPGKKVDVTHVPAGKTAVEAPDSQAGADVLSAAPSDGAPAGKAAGQGPGAKAATGDDAPSMASSDGAPAAQAAVDGPGAQTAADVLSAAPSDGAPAGKQAGAGKNQVIEISLPEAVTFNRLVLQEDVMHSGERVARHAVDIFTDGGWKQIASATNIGYKRILRFPVQTASRIRIRILESRAEPSIKTISAHLYEGPSPDGSSPEGAEP